MKKHILVRRDREELGQAVLLLVALLMRLYLQDREHRQQGVSHEQQQQHQDLEIEPIAHTQSRSECFQQKIPALRKQQERGRPMLPTVASPVTTPKI